MDPLFVDRALVERLHQAKASYLEQFFTAEPVPPDCEVVRIGEACAFYGTERQGFGRRAILTGRESYAELDEILDRYEARGEYNLVEVNPANFYQPDYTDEEGSRLCEYLIRKGFFHYHFRSVWYKDASEDQADRTSGLEIIGYDSSQLETLRANIW